jgi:hypothetical protein
LKIWRPREFSNAHQLTPNQASHVFIGCRKLVTIQIPVLKVIFRARECSEFGNDEALDCYPLATS